MPEALARAVKGTPYLGGLCVPIAKLAGAMDQIDRQKGSIYTLYKKALEDSANIQKGVS